MARVSDKTYLEMADERLHAAKYYRKFAVKQSVKKYRKLLLQWALREEQRAACFYASHIEITS